ncbi:MAG: SAM-dependent methyltransferase [Cohnella sp.]|jgi:hypothetical protein|nr:SAM-dependent methyltransferase [Cohnella sp.]
MSKSEIKLDIARIVFIGRTFDEYMSMFNLRKEDLIGQKILDCPAGACSFTAIANQLGADVTATDIAYFHDVESLEEKGFHDVEHAMEQMEKVQSNYIWDYFKSVKVLSNHRTQALSDCISHMKQSPSCYIPSILPALPFDDKQFDLTLSAHFLFTYADRLNYQFHLQTIQELMRVTKQEIRFFPLVDLYCRRYEHLDKLIDYIHSEGYSSEEIVVPYEFQTGANRMLRIKKA